MSVQVTGEAELKSKLLSLGRDMDKALANGVFLTANDVRTDAIKSIQEQSFGSYVQRSRQGGEGTYTHVASKPGSAPNTDNGGLVRSIAVEMNWSKREAFVGSNLDYGAFLELGTKNMDPRPWLEPALRKNMGNLNRNLSKAADAAIQARSR